MGTKAAAQLGASLSRISILLTLIKSCSTARVNSRMVRRSVGRQPKGSRVLTVSKVLRTESSLIETLFT